MPRKHAKNEILRGNVLTFVEALLALAYGEINIAEDKLENTFKIEWVGKEAKQLFVSGETWVVTSKRTGLKKKRECGTTKKDLWILMKEYWQDEKALRLPKNQDNTPVNYQKWDNNKQPQAFQDIFTCLTDLGIFKYDPKQKNINPRSRYCKFYIQLGYSLKATKEQQLAVIKELLDLEFDLIEESPHQTKLIPDNLKYIEKEFNDKFPSANADTVPPVTNPDSDREKPGIVFLILGDSVKSVSSHLADVDLSELSSHLSSITEDKTVDNLVRKAYQESLPPDANLWGEGQTNLTQMLSQLDQFRKLGDFLIRLSQDENLPLEYQSYLKNLAEKISEKKV